MDENSQSNERNSFVDLVRFHPPPVSLCSECLSILSLHGGFIRRFNYKRINGLIASHSYALEIPVERGWLNAGRRWIINSRGQLITTETIRGIIRLTKSHSIEINRRIKTKMKMEIANTIVGGESLRACLSSRKIRSPDWTIQKSLIITILCCV